MSVLSSNPIAELAVSGSEPGYPMAVSHARVPDEEVIGEKRHNSRRPLHCSVQMIPLATEQQPHPSDAINAECLNISDGGLYGTVSIGFGMAVGQRYIFRLRTRELGPDGQQVVLRQGVLLRTELLKSADGDQIGIGVRFCGHRSGVLSTPAEA